jgi:hypothetical protein
MWFALIAQWHALSGYRNYLTALPRGSLNGDYQSLTYMALYLSGAPFAL